MKRCLERAKWLSQSDVATADRLLVMLGSNDRPFERLAFAKQALVALPYSLSLTPLLYYINPDYTASSGRLYHNQAAFWRVRPRCLSDIDRDLKAIEDRALRNRSGAQTLTLDLDIVALASGDRWYKIDARFPLKKHERVCLGILD